MINYLLLLLISNFIGCSSPKEEVTDKTQDKPNVLFIAIDDLRPELGCYGKDYIHSPHIDKLASEGVVFSNHFVQVPTCGASRHCLLTGQLPVSTAHLRNSITANTISGQPEMEAPETFIHQLKRFGYYTVGIEMFLVRDILMD
ncbi:MAG: sulfatase-like hydrolase/transferase [Cyclobacteriaceae bacterium]|nr:sulfatase-like hydrolase/transferase [Cyclobacteriaceae bacterium]